MKQTFEDLSDARNSVSDAKIKTKNAEIYESLTLLQKEITELMVKAKDCSEINWDD